MAYRIERENVSDTGPGTSHRRERVWILAHAHEFHDDSGRHSPGEALWERKSSVISGSQSDVAHAHDAGQLAGEGSRQEGDDAGRRGENVAHAPGEGAGQDVSGLRAGPEGTCRGERTARPIPDADSGGWYGRPGEQWPRGWFELEDCGEAVADSLSPGLEGHAGDGERSDGQGRVSEEAERPTRESGLRGGGSCSEIGNSQPGLGGMVDGLAAGMDCNHMERSDWWQVEPEIPRVSASQPARVQRLKAIGNGQVPRVAAVAWITLERILRGDG